MKSMMTTLSTIIVLTVVFNSFKISALENNGELIKCIYFHDEAGVTALTPYASKSGLYSQCPIIDPSTTHKIVRELSKTDPRYAPTSNVQVLKDTHDCIVRVKQFGG